MLTPTLATSCAALPPEGAGPCLGRPGAAALRKYLITITMADGSQGRHRGLYADGFEAVIETMSLFPQARRIAARRLA